MHVTDLDDIGNLLKAMFLVHRPEWSLSYGYDGYESQRFLLKTDGGEFEIEITKKGKPNA